MPRPYMVVPEETNEAYVGDLDKEHIQRGIQIMKDIHPNKSLKVWEITGAEKITEINNSKSQ